MNQKLIIFMIIFVVIIIVGIISYFLISKKSPSTGVSTTPPPTVESTISPSKVGSTTPSSTGVSTTSPSKVGSTTPINAECRIGTSGPSIQPGTQAALDANVDSYYSFTNSISRLGTAIKNSVEGFMFPERFTISSGLIPNTNKNALIDNKLYITGILDPTKQIQPLTRERNGGIPCGRFPDKVYREVQAPTPTYRLVSDVNFYPESVPAEIALKANIGVTNLASAIAYASSKGYTVFSFDENTTIRGSPQGDIIFYREADISDLNFWKQGGGGVGPFRVYATTSSKLQTMPCPNTSIVSPVSQIRDSSGICRNPPCSIAGQVRDVYGKCS